MAKYYTFDNFTFTTGQYNGMKPNLLTPTLIKLEEGNSLNRWLANNTGYTEKTETEAKALWKTYAEGQLDEDTRAPELDIETSTHKVLNDLDGAWEDING